MTRTARMPGWADRGIRRVPIRGALRNDTDYLLSSPVNEARLRAAIAELNAGRGMPVDLADLRQRLRGLEGR